MVVVWKPKFGQGDFERLSEEVVYKDYFSVTKREVKFNLFEGGVSKAIIRERFERGRTAAVLPFDSKTKNILLVEQFRIGAMEDVDSAWMLEIIAGIVDKNDSPQETIVREAKEEADCNIQDPFLIGDFYLSVGGSNELMSIYCAKADLSSAGGVHGATDEGEDIKVHVFNIEDLDSLYSQHAIRTAPAMVATQWLQRNYQNLI